MMQHRTTSHNTRNTRGGFTLVEAICSMTIVSIVAVGGMSSLVSAIAQYRDTVASTRLHADMSAAMDRVVKEIRSVGLNAAGNAPAISSLTATSLSTVGGLVITLNASGSLMLTDPALPSQSYTLLDSVTTFSIQGFDQSNTALAMPVVAMSQLERAQITLTATRQGAVATLRTRVFLRCMSAGAGL